MKLNDREWAQIAIFCGNAAYFLATTGNRQDAENAELAAYWCRRIGEHLWPKPEGLPGNQAGDLYDPS